MCIEIVTGQPEDICLTVLLIPAWSSQRPELDQAICKSESNVAQFNPITLHHKRKIQLLQALDLYEESRLPARALSTHVQAVRRGVGADDSDWEGQAKAQLLSMR